MSSTENVDGDTGTLAIRDPVFSDHALSEMTRRGLSIADVRDVLSAPNAVTPVRTGRIVAQRTVRNAENGRNYLIRVFVDVDRHPPVVVTAYRTSKLTKYGGAS